MILIFRKDRIIFLQDEQTNKEHSLRKRNVPFIVCEQKGMVSNYGGCKK